MSNAAPGYWQKLSDLFDLNPPKENPVPAIPPITQEFRADVRQFRAAVEAIGLHFSALAGDLAVLEQDPKADATAARVGRQLTALADELAECSPSAPADADMRDYGGNPSPQLRTYRLDFSPYGINDPRPSAWVKAAAYHRDGDWLVFTGPGPDWEMVAEYQVVGVESVSVS